MRFSKFESVDEYVQIGYQEFMKRNGGSKETWIPSRQTVYAALCNTLPDNIMLSMDKLKQAPNTLFELDMNPSQFIKCGQDFQLSARIGGISQDIILKYFLEIPNKGILLRNNKVESIRKQMRDLPLIECSGRIINDFNSILRTLSETIYYDDHTVGGDLYGPFRDGNYDVVFRYYNHLRPTDLALDISTSKYKGVMSACYYIPDTIQIDDLGNISYTNGDFVFPAHFKGVIYLADDSTIPINHINEIDAIILEIESILYKLMDHYKEMGIKERRIQLLRTTLYAYKPLLKNAGIDWEPTDDEINIYLRNCDRISPFENSKTKGEPNSEETNKIRRVIDPRMTL